MDQTWDGDPAAAPGAVHTAQQTVRDKRTFSFAHWLIFMGLVCLTCNVEKYPGEIFTV